MKPDILIRQGNKFKINKMQIRPYMKKHMGDIQKAVEVACQDFKYSPQYYKKFSNKEKLQELNKLIYELLEKWGIYKG